MGIIPPPENILTAYGRRWNQELAIMAYKMLHATLILTSMLTQHQVLFYRGDWIKQATNQFNIYKDRAYG